MTRTTPKPAPQWYESWDKPTILEKAKRLVDKLETGGLDRIRAATMTFECDDRLVKITVRRQENQFRLECYPVLAEGRYEAKAKTVPECWGQETLAAVVKAFMAAQLGALRRRAELHWQWFCGQVDMTVDQVGQAIGGRMGVDPRDVNVFSQMTKDECEEVIAAMTTSQEDMIQEMEKATRERQKRRKRRGLPGIED